MKAPKSGLRRGALMRGALGCLAAWATGARAAEPPLPARDLLVELRETTAPPGAADGWNARSADAAAARDRPPQQLRVRNGEAASLALTTTRPLQVWQVLPGVLLPVAVPGAQWIRAGQHISVRPRWPGGREPVGIELQVQASRFDPAVAPGSAEAPARSESQLLTTARIPLAQWVTIAATGTGADDPNGVASGQAAAASRRVLQLRVSVLP